MSAKKTIVAIGSKNPVKIKAVKNAFTTVWPNINWQFDSASVDSGVSDQPMTIDETILGATNRATSALKNTKNAKFGVGLEGGLQQASHMWFDGGWIVVIDALGNKSVGSTVQVLTPSKIIERINQGQELGDVIDELFEGTNLSQKEGHFGIMTKNHITRTKGYTDGVIMALSGFLHPHFFDFIQS